MNLFATLFAAEDVDPARSLHPILPEQAELIYGSLATIIMVGLLVKFAGPAVKKAMAGRTAGIQEDLDLSENAKTEAEAEAASIRQAAGDIDAERQRLFAEADTQAEALLVDGRARLDQEVIDLEARADADIASASGRVNDELRAEIARLSNRATERVLASGALDDAAQQDLIENFIAKVGASS